MNTFSSILNGKCPQCREGYMFKNSVLNFTKAAIMEKKCEHCNLVYEIEPGFFWGAMYISYAFSVAIAIVTSFILMSFGVESFLTIFGTIVFLVVLLSKISIRYSRTLLIYFFGSITYKPKGIK